MSLRWHSLGNFPFPKENISSDHQSNILLGGCLCPHIFISLFNEMEILASLSRYTFSFPSGSLAEWWLWFCERHHLITSLLCRWKRPCPVTGFRKTSQFSQWWMQCFLAEADQVFIFPENREGRVFNVMCFWCWKFSAEKAGLSSTGMVEAFSGNFVIFLDLQTEID